MNVASSTVEIASNSIEVRHAEKHIGSVLLKLENPSIIMIVAKTIDPKVIHFTRSLACFLIDYSPTCSLSENSISVLVDSNIVHTPAFDIESLFLAEPHYKKNLLLWDQEYCKKHADLIDIIITLGGDGTVLYTSWLFQVTLVNSQGLQVPPIIPFHFGSLGFLTNFNISDIKQIVEKILGCHGNGVRVNMRMRLKCTVWRDISSFPSDTGSLVKPADESIVSRNSEDFLQIAQASLSPPRVRINTQSAKSFNSDDIGSLLDTLSATLPSIQQTSCPSPILRPVDISDINISDPLENARPTDSFQILNDLVVDRGPSAFMSQLEIFVDNRHLTTAQADGLVISTPTGSTAYSLSAGGSLVHPQVPSILVTPICPHTLSFRPMLLPDSVELTIAVPKSSRVTCVFASFDGRQRIQLNQGDAIVVSMSKVPVPTICDVDQSSDWFESLKRCLYWNERTRQK